MHRGATPARNSKWHFSLVSQPYCRRRCPRHHTPKAITTAPARPNQVMAYCRWSSLRWTVSGPGFGMPLCGHRRFQVDVERRDLFPAERARHRQMIPGEPQPLCDVFRRRQRAGLFRKAEVAGQGHRGAGDEPRHRAILLGAVLHRVLHEAGIDRDGLAVRQRRRQERPGAGTGNIVAHGGAGAVDHGIGGSIGRRKLDAAEFVAGRRRARSIARGRGNAAGGAASRSVKAAISACFSARRCNCHTPRPTHSATIASVNHGKAGDAAPRSGSSDGHFGSRSISWPGAAL